MIGIKGQLLTTITTYDLHTNESQINILQKSFLHKPAPFLPFIFSAPSSYDCTFESGLCTWTQATDDQFNWVRANGNTGTTQTGPSNDHTIGNSEYITIYLTFPICSTRVIPRDGSTSAP